MRGKGAEGEGKEVAKDSLKNEKNSMEGEMLSPDNPKMREKRKKQVKRPYLRQNSGDKWQGKIVVNAKLLQYFSKKSAFSFRPYVVRVCPPLVGVRGWISRAKGRPQGIDSTFFAKNVKIYFAKYYCA